MSDNSLYNQEAEALVLAAILREPDAYYSINDVRLTEQDFLGVENRRIFKAILEVVAEKSKPDLPLVLEALKLSGHHDATEYVSRLTTLPCSTAQAIEYSKIVRGLGVNRQLGQAGAKIIEISREKRSDYESAIGESETVLRRVTDSLPAPERSPRPEDILRRIRSSGPIPTIPISFSPTLQHITGGLRPGTLWVIGGFSSVGKSSWASNLAVDALSTRGKRVAVISTEMTSEAYVIRMLAIKSGVPMSDIQNNVTIGLENQKNLVTAERWIESSPVTIYDSLYKWNAIKSQLRTLKEREGLDLVMIDYIQNVRVTGDIYTDSRDVAVESLQLAKELNCSFVDFSQVSNEMANQDITEKGQGSYYSFKGAGDIRDTADVALMLRRNRRQQSPVLDVQIAKHRQGALAEFSCRMDLPTGRIQEMIREEEEYDD